MYHLKKSLAQHFLKDEGVVNQIIESLKKCRFNNLLEVGPGGGALTKKLILLPDINLKAVELDEEKIEFLHKKYPILNGKIIHESILTMKLPFEEPFTIIGNFPYNISTQILFKIIEWKDHVPNAIGMFQKEVAERAASKEGSKVYGVLSVLVQYYYDVEYLFSVDSKSFTPPPKVQSAVIKLTAKKDLLPVKSEKAFWLLVKTAFNQRRKTLRNALKSIMLKEVLEDKLFDRRAETLSLEEFANLTFKM